MVAPAQKAAKRVSFPPPASTGPYIVDFFCPDAKLILEVDGGQHAEDDDSRTVWLEARGYRVVRFWNNEVLSNTDGVLTVILGVLHEPPTRQR